MDVSVGKRWEAFVEAVVADGSYGSADQVVVEGLRLVQERESKLAALRETIQASIARGGSYTADEVMANVDAVLARRNRHRQS